MRTIGALLRRRPSDSLYIVQAGVLLSLASMASQAIPFKYLAPHLGTYLEESSSEGSPYDTVSVARVRRAVEVAASCLPWTPSCLARAITAKLMLRRLGLQSTLYLGVAREGRQLHAHAWLRNGTNVVTGAEEQERFSAIAWFT
jgi:hypothetical protein